MKPYAQYTKQERTAELAALREKLQEYAALHLSLNMARGKPSKAQLDMTSDLLTVLSGPSDCMDGGIDARWQVCPRQESSLRSSSARSRRRSSSAAMPA